MKWLFAVLVALNIIVFGGMVAHRMTNKQTEAAVAPLEGGTHELVPPASLNPPVNMPAENMPPDWLNAMENQSDIREPESEEAIAARKQKAREEKAAKEKKEREEKAKREKEASEKAANSEQNVDMGALAGRQCTPSATVSIDEDDYHRIKGLLNRWPHAASRSIEKRAAKKGESVVNKTFRVLLPADGDVSSQLENLSSKGFVGVAYDGQVSMGVTRSRSSAQILISRLASAGFGGARILEQEEKSNSPDAALSVARMNITFMAVSERDAQDLRNVVGRYGNLNIRACR